ncbi:peptidylprolyl isomerase [Anatilimnocola floriformis]|uniref:peptidylprolyl isomerase n=1 Tax=Anatilimnocola floriformis TaxID=2948575 RepID=UPI0020C2AEC8|nr:peptidylprolyl isomerase [Anatilimnocola floriformis]
MKLRQLLLTTTPVWLLTLQPAVAWQYQPGPRPDPYAQPPVQNTNSPFQFAPDPNAPMQPVGPPMFVPPQPQPQPQPQFGPPQQFAPPQFQPGQFAPPQFAPPGQPVGPPPQFQQPQFQPPMAGAPMGPPPGQPPANSASQTPLIPGFDPTAENVNPEIARTLFQPSQIVATVGNQYILYGDVEPTVNQMIEPALKANPGQRDQIEAMKPKLIQQITRQQVESKLMYLDFEREIEAKAGRDKMNEIRTEMSKKMRDNFEKQLTGMREKMAKSTPEEIQELAKRDPIVARLALLMKEHNLETLGDLDRVLRQGGSTLEKQQRSFLETYLGRDNIQQKLKVKTEVSHLEMINYYHEHAEDFAVKARARFEILSVKFANFPDKRAAEQQMVQMGNDVIFGTPFAAVAKRGSQDINAANGGVYDWTNEKSLASDQIDQAIFSQEVGKLSPIIEDPKGLHIVRVTERQPAGYIPFTDAQVKIKELINQQRRDAAIKVILEGIRTKTVVWTIYDADATNVAAQPAANPKR